MPVATVMRGQWVTLSSGGLVGSSRPTCSLKLYGPLDYRSGGKGPVPRAGSSGLQTHLRQACVCTAREGPQEGTQTNAHCAQGVKRESEQHHGGFYGVRPESWCLGGKGVILSLDQCNIFKPAGKNPANNTSSRSREGQRRAHTQRTNSTATGP